MTQFSRNTHVEHAASDSHYSPTTDGPRRNVLLSIWTHRWIVVVTMCLVSAVAIMHLYRAERIYKASARLTVERSGPRVVASDPSEIGQSQNYLNTQCQVLRSRKVFQGVAELDQIGAMETFQGRSDQIVGYLKRNVSADVGRKDDIITVSVASPFPKDAATLANAIVDAYKSDLESQKKSSVRQIIEFYSKEKSHAEKKLAEARQKRVELQTRYADLALGSERTSPVYDRLNRLSAEITQVQLEVLNIKAAYDATKSMASDPVKIRQLLDSRQFKSETADLRRQMRELQQRFAQVGKTYLPNFPDVTLMQQSIKALEEELQREDRRVFDAYLAELEATLITKQNNQSQLSAYFDETKAAAMSQNTVVAQFVTIQAECASWEKYDSDLAIRIRELTPLSDDVMVNVNVIENARWEEAMQIEPNVSNTMYLAIIGGLVLGCLLALARDLLDQRLRGAEEIKHLTGLPVLGVVPHIEGKITPAKRAQQLHLDPTGDVAESYRTVRTSVYFGSPTGAARTILITSPAPGEGKSTLASNLAIAMAQAGNRILLLDADFRKPTQHKVWEIDKSIGLSNVLAGKQQLEDAIRPTPVNGLHVLPCGPIPANPSEILNSQMFADVLDEVRERYDHVLIDSPPVMPVTDARILAASCDATVVAIRAEKTARKAALFARDVLRSVGARMLGVVVNDVPRGTGIYGYYYSDAQLYRYGYGVATRPAPEQQAQGEKIAVKA